MNILVFVEHRDGAIKKASLEAVKAAAGIASGMNATVTAAVLGAAVGAPESLGGYGANKVVQVADARLDLYSSTAATAALAAVAAREAADIVFLSATAMGKDLAPRLAVRLDGALVPDVTALQVENGAILATRPVYAGKALEKVQIMTAAQVYSLRPNVFSAGAASGDVCPVEQFDAGLTDASFAVKSTGTTIASGKLDVAEAAMIVSGGRGMQGPEHWPLIENLASVLHAATGASRAVVDAGWRPHAEQVGQTGKTVSPTLYVACGISGAVQHLAGMSSSKVIVAINKDKDAPIFQTADYGIVGDVFEVLPAFTDALKQHMGS
ncbi:MAG: electron transfer flavoprotein subunit alpha/FixB family protein [Ignavibacteria bacterium]|nr:electron transfer flavoprotein subunit alpha/FixB family protein [Ignavibacteria bacterium]